MADCPQGSGGQILGLFRFGGETNIMVHRSDTERAFPMQNNDGPLDKTPNSGVTEHLRIGSGDSGYGLSTVSARVDVSRREGVRCKRLVRDLSIGLALLGADHALVREVAALL